MEQIANAASVALVGDGRVLLIQRAREPFAGLWTLPGGRAEAGETAVETATREIAEELRIAVTGLRRLTDLIVAERWRLAVFATTEFAGAVAPSDEIADWRWVTELEAAGLPTTPQLDRVLALALSDLWAT